MDRITLNPWDDEYSPLPITEREAFYQLLGRIFEEMPDNLTKWRACLGLGTIQCAGKSIGEMAGLARCSEASLLQGAVDFCAGVGIKASPFLRSAIRTRLASGEAKVKDAAAPTNRQA